MKRLSIPILAAGFFLLIQTAQATDWAAPQRLTWISGISVYPAIAVNSYDDPCVFWANQTPGNWDIYYRCSTDGALTWTAAQRLTLTPGDSLSPAVAAGGSGDLHLVWYDDTPGNYEIYHKKATPGF
jgi:hypothetical protein